ncbi:MAG: heptosyltransferase-2 [Candidatus Omnitrophota bacterium]|jgi:heptosyltransferase-2
MPAAFDKKPRILIVGVDWLGDVMMSTPLIRAIRKTYPEAFLAYSTTQRCLPLLKDNPHLDAVIAYDEKVFLLGILDNIRLWFKMREYHFDQAWFLHGSKTRAFVAFLAGIEKRLGFLRKNRNIFYTHAITRPSALEVHRGDIYLGLLECKTPELDAERMEICINAEELQAWQKQAAHLGVEEKSPYIVLHIGGNWEAKRWDALKFRALIKKLINAGYFCVLCGTKSESELTQLTLKDIPKTQAITLAGLTSLRELACLIKNAQLLVSNDSGPIHLAAGVATPAVGIFGPTSPALTAPRGLDVFEAVYQRIGCEAPCYYQACDSIACMDAISVDDVYIKSIRILEKSPI